MWQNCGRNSFFNWEIFYGRISFKIKFKKYTGKNTATYITSGGIALLIYKILFQFKKEMTHEKQCTNKINKMYTEKELPVTLKKTLKIYVQYHLYKISNLIRFQL